MSEGIRGLIIASSLAFFGITLFDAIVNLHKILNPAINYIYNYVGTKIAPNMVTVVIFDWRGYDTLGEALILVTAVIVTLLVFGRGKVKIGVNK